MKKHTLKSLTQEHPIIKIESPMTQEILHHIAKSSADTEILEEDIGYLFFKYRGTKMVLLSDEEHNRMRIISPITAYSPLAPKIKDSLMNSNFHLALDARYAVSENVLYAAFIHPLSTLTTEDFKSALKQVYNLADSFGMTYSSGQLEFTTKK
ncbi:hypothetical protein GJV85_02895 [Sulfurimonas aquatica]|uniref:Uncharacterized protein n=1 Tax=Sulfurimonas aquatica TaxID=2672570 RepID=A0A975GC37_9BACT|nr:hypothetical protein [Sulfurimonas aquatica]QSZ41107.1 hypothetical protein GJV85_02895 [Sulfurimonas aquatica]